MRWEQCITVLTLSNDKQTGVRWKQGDTALHTLSSTDVEEMTKRVVLGTSDNDDC